jgi:hypothetical protein
LIVGGFASMMLLTAWSQRQAGVRQLARGTTVKKFDTKRWNTEGMQLLTEWHGLTK